jgi:hypothetical protein
MRDLGSDTRAGTGAAATLTAPTSEEIEIFARRLAADPDAIDDGERIDRIAALETLQCARASAPDPSVEAVVSCVGSGGGVVRVGARSWSR